MESAVTAHEHGHDAQREAYQREARYWAQAARIAAADPEGDPGHPCAWRVGVEAASPNTAQAVFHAAQQSFSLCADEGPEAAERCAFFARMFERAMERLGAPPPESEPKAG